MASTKSQQSNILNRAQLQTALNTLYNQSLTAFPHDEFVWRNHAEILMKAIDQCAPISDDNMDGIAYDSLPFPPSPPRLSRQLAGVSQTPPPPQVPLQPAKYSGVDLKMHEDIEKDVWCQHMQQESCHYITEEIPIDLISAIYSKERVQCPLGDPDKDVSEYLKWISTHCTEAYEEWRDVPELMHDHMALAVLCRKSFKLKNNVYKIEDMLVEKSTSTPETIVDNPGTPPPPPKLWRQPTRGKHGGFNSPVPTLELPVPALVPQFGSQGPKYFCIKCNAGMCFMGSCNECGWNPHTNTNSVSARYEFTQEVCDNN